MEVKIKIPNRPFPVEKIETIIKNSPARKALDLFIFPRKLCKTFKDLLTSMLLKLLQSIYKGRKFPNYFYMANITLIIK